MPGGGEKNMGEEETEGLANPIVFLQDGRRET
jgi:hypothetical protein